MTWSSFLTKLKDAKTGSRELDLEYAELAGLYPDVVPILLDVARRFGQNAIEVHAPWLPDYTTNVQDACDQLPPGWYLDYLGDDVAGMPGNPDKLIFIGCTCGLSTMNGDAPAQLKANVVFQAPTRALAVIGAIVMAKIELASISEALPDDVTEPDSDAEEP